MILILSRLTSRFLAYTLPEQVYKLILWPGVVVHEFSHLLGALITFTKVTGFSILPKNQNGKRVLGSLSHESTSNPLALVVISTFPFLGGSFILWVLSVWLIPYTDLDAPKLIVNSFDSWWPSLVHYIWSWWNFSWNLILVLDWTSWLTWVFVYLALAISAHLAPSNKDLSYTATGLSVISLLVIFISIVINLLGKKINFNIFNWITDAISFFTPLVSFSLSLLIVFTLISAFAAGIKRLNNNVVWWG